MAGKATVVRAAFDIRYTLQLTSDAVPVAREFLVLQTALGYGSCHFDIAHAFHARCVGQQIRDIDSAAFPREYRIAALDAAAANATPAADERYTISGAVFEKVEQRSAIIAAEVSRLLDGSPGRVLLVGALGNLVSHLLRVPGVSLLATDYSPTVIGRRLGSVEVASGDETPASLGGVDIAVVTGMVLANGSIDTILDAAIRSSVQLVMYLQTGANLVTPYLQAGVAVAISEKYPFYFIAHLSKIAFLCPVRSDGTKAPSSDQSLRQ